MLQSLEKLLFFLSILNINGPDPVFMYVVQYDIYGLQSVSTAL